MWIGRLPYAELEVVDDSHRLMKHMTAAVFRARIERLYALGAGAKNAAAAAAATSAAAIVASAAPSTPVASPLETTLA
jgi:hypothetical protein